MLEIVAFLVAQTGSSAGELPPWAWPLMAIGAGVGGGGLTMVAKGVKILRKMHQTMDDELRPNAGRSLNDRVRITMRHQDELIQAVADLDKANQHRSDRMILALERLEDAIRNPENHPRTRNS